MAGCNYNSVCDANNVNQCENAMTNKCSDHADCNDLCDSAADDGTLSPRYHCECQAGFHGNGQRCHAATDEVICGPNVMNMFQANLRKLRIADIKNPTMFAGRNAVIVEVQTAMKNWILSSSKYTAFLEFGRKQCGAKFIRAMANGAVDLNIFDKYNTKMKGELLQ